MYINSNYDSFTEKDVKKQVRALANKVVGLILYMIGQPEGTQGEQGVSDSKPGI